MISYYRAFYIQEIKSILLILYDVNCVFSDSNI